MNASSWSFEKSKGGGGWRAKDVAIYCTEGWYDVLCI